MDIFVKLYTGKTIILNTMLDDSIYNIKHKICDKVNIPPNKQKLTYTNKILKYGKLSDYDIQQYYTIHLSETDTIQIFVNAPQNTITMEVETIDTIDNLKEYIKQKFSIPVNMQCLMCSGKILRKGTLDEYNIKLNSYIIVNLALRGD